MRTRRPWPSMVLSGAIVTASGIGPVVAQSEAPPFANPPILRDRGVALERSRSPHLAAATTVPPRREFDLTVRYVENGIRNPATGRTDKVKLRGYVGEGIDPNAPYVAPAIEVSPGQRVTVQLTNELPADPTCTAKHDALAFPHCANGTNLHAHGFWVSPAGNSDNVLVSINPGKSFTYYYDLSDDHPAGTFWYHPHRHGSTALQVSSGMAGALIVRGNRLPTADAQGDLDTLLTNADGSRMEERILVMQQIQYACFGADGRIKTKTATVDGQEQVVAWICDPGDVGTIEKASQFGPPSWGQSGRHTTINGLVQPRFEALAGRVERWRMIHAGVRDTIAVAFRPMKDGAPAAAGLSPAASAAFVQRYCDGAPISHHLIAADGLTMKAAQPTRIATFQPGYRFDALVVFPRAGTYCVTNEEVAGSGNVAQEARSRQLLATVEVAPGTAAPDAAATVEETLIAAAKRTMPAPIRDAVVADLENGLAFSHFVPHPDIAASEVTGKQELVFFIDVTKTPLLFGVADKSIDPDRFDPSAFKPLPYDPSHVDRVLPLGGVEEWTLQSAFVSHPFHIHVNAFQIVEVLDPNGRDVSAPDVEDDADGGKVDHQYRGLKGVWKDTLWIKSLIRSPAQIPSGLKSSLYKIKLRTRYERYIGQFVLHCHILDHEDQGMMENVCIDLADGGGANCAQLGATRKHDPHASEAAVRKPHH